MATQQSPAFILRKVNYGERHVILHLLSRDNGRVSAIAYNARASKRRFAGALEPLRIVEASLSPPRSGDLYGLDEMEVVQDFPGIEDRLESITAAGYATELVRETWREGEDSRRLFDLLTLFYKHLPACPTSLAIARLVYQFEYQLLDLYGLAPNIDGCSRCACLPKTMERLHFSRHGEGLICTACRHPGDAVAYITPETLAVLHHLANPDLPLPTNDTEAALSQAGRVLSNAIDHNIDRPLPARQMLRTLL